MIHEPEKKPPHGIMTEGRLVKVYDGDTVELEFKYKVRVRLLDCWAPEIRTRNLKRKAAGLHSRNVLAHSIPSAKYDINKNTFYADEPVHLYIPIEEARHLGEVFSMGRVLGTVYLVDEEQSISDKQVQAGQAYKTKAELKVALKELS